MDMKQFSVPAYHPGEKSLSPSTDHRWASALARFPHTTQAALNLIGLENPATRACCDLAQLTIIRRKYKRPSRKPPLLSCLRLLVVEVFFKAAFNLSIFTNLFKKRDILQF